MMVRCASARCWPRSRYFHVFLKGAARSNFCATSCSGDSRVSSSTSSSVMRIAYLVNQYPMVSHSFIRREILALERRGLEITRISLRGWKAELPDDTDQLERKRTRYVLRGGVPALLFSFAHALLTRPLRLINALWLACRMGWRAERPLLVHFVYLAEACRI